MSTINRWLKTGAAWITRVVGTPWTAIIFAVITLVSLPAVIQSGNVVVLIQWVGSVFLQLVLLPIIMIGQDVQGQKTEQIIRETHDEVTQILASIHTHVKATHEHVTKEKKP